MNAKHSFMHILKYYFLLLNYYAYQYQLAIAIGAQHQILWFQVPVDEVMGVQVIECLNDTARYKFGGLLIEVLPL